MAKVTLVAFALIVLFGGVVGFTKAKSKASLIAGIISSILLLGAFLLAGHDVRLGLWLGDFTAVLLYIIFHIRYNKVKKFMPSGFMMVLSCLTIIIVTAALVLRVQH